MRKAIALVLTIMAVFLLFGCVQQAPPAQEGLPPAEELPTEEVTQEQPTEEVPAQEGPSAEVTEPITINMLECNYNLAGITKVQTQFGMHVKVYWQIPVTIKNNSSTDAKNVAITFTPIGEEAWQRTYTIDKIAAGETVDEVFNYTVRGVTWVNPRVTVTAEGVEVSEACQLAEIQKPA